MSCDQSDVVDGSAPAGQDVLEQGMAAEVSKPLGVGRIIMPVKPVVQVPPKVDVPQPVKKSVFSDPDKAKDSEVVGHPQDGVSGELADFMFSHAISMLEDMGPSKDVLWDDDGMLIVFGSGIRLVAKDGRDSVIPIKHVVGAALLSRRIELVVSEDDGGVQWFELDRGQPHAFLRHGSLEGCQFVAGPFSVDDGIEIICEQSIIRLPWRFPFVEPIVEPVHFHVKQAAMSVFGAVVMSEHKIYLHASCGWVEREVLCPGSHISVSERHVMIWDKGLIQWFDLPELHSVAAFAPCDDDIQDLSMGSGMVAAICRQGRVVFWDAEFREIGKGCGLPFEGPVFFSQGGISGIVKGEKIQLISPSVSRWFDPGSKDAFIDMAVPVAKGFVILSEDQGHQEVSFQSASFGG